MLGLSFPPKRRESEGVCLCLRREEEWRNGIVDGKENLYLLKTKVFNKS